MPDRRMLKATKETTKKDPPKTIHDVLAYPKELEFWESDRGLILVEGWSRDGLTNDQLANNMGICRDTFYKWLKASPTLKTRITHARNEVDFEIENILFKTATGFTYQEEAVTKDGDIVTVTKFQPPNLEAQKFILTNRKNGKWRARQDVNLNAEADIKVSSKSDKFAEKYFGDN